MGIRQFRPMTPGTRFRSVSDFADVTKTEPEKSLLEPLRRTGGRNNKGHITNRWQGGGHKRRYRRIDFRREKFGIPAKVAAVEHELLSIGKAGKSRWLGRNPRVRGVAMNPVDHPLGGGEGKTSGGRPPTNPWGKVEGKKTRHKKKKSSKLIVRGRKRGKATQ